MDYQQSLFNLCLGSLFLVFLCTLCTACVDEERIALLELKASRQPFSTEPFTTWVNDKSSDCCAWERIKCHNSTSRVAQLVLYRFFSEEKPVLLNASLFLPFEDLQQLDLAGNSIYDWEVNHGIEKLSVLKKLEVLDLSANDLKSNVLVSLSELTSIKTLNLDMNHFGDGEGSSAQVSRGIGSLSKLKKLEFLNLDQNYLSNKVMPLFGSLTTTLSLSYNNISNISEGFCELKKLRGIILQNTSLEGKIPPCLVNFTSLRILDLSGNQLTGNIPPFLTSKMKSLVKLDFSGNQFTGIIPPSILHNLTLLQHVSFSENKLDGTTLVTSTSEPNFKLKSLGLSNCNLNMSTTKLLNFLHGQTDLRSIDLSHNNIHGKFPEWLVANNMHMNIMILNNNSLSGYIYFPFHHHTNLELFDISNNHIEGHLQTNVGHILPRIRYLNLSQNHMEGSIPTSLSNMEDLEFLDLSNNNFTGEIPHSLGLLQLLSSLILSNNKLHGQVSSLLFNTMDTLSLSNNQLTGFILNNNTHLGILTMLDISKNNISGKIPSWIANLTMVKALVMGDNFFHGLIPLELCNLASLQFLDLSQNDLSGGIPSCLNLTSLRYMHLQRNKLSGGVPPAILQSPNLRTLDLNHNNFSGSIPSRLGLLENLSVLLLKGKGLRGFVPYELCKLNKIRILDLSHNGFSGPIPPCFSNMAFGQSGGTEYDSDDSVMVTGFPFHNDLRVLGNEYYYRIYESGTYVGQEEVEFMTKRLSSLYKGGILSYMAGMDLSCNKLTGHIPHEFGALTSIRALNLSHNELTGSIPKAWSALKQLESMDLSHNKLMGEIPLQLTDLNFLSVFSVAYNNLSGRLPDTKAQFGTFSETSYEGNPYLCGPPLQKQCKVTAPTGSVTVAIARVSEKFGVDPISILTSCVGAYIMSLLGLVIVLYVNPYWRRMWFDRVDACLSVMFPFWSEAFYRVSNPFT